MNTITQTMFISVLVNTFLSIIKIVSGLIFKCGSLIADGIHSFSDLTTDFVSIVGNKLSNKPADKKHPFGYGKIEYITSAIIGIFVLVLGFIIIIESYNVKLIIPNLVIITVTIFTIIIKYILATFIYNRGIKYKNNILISSGSESKTDVISSVIVLVSIILMQFSNELKFLKYSDLFATIIISLLIIKTGYDILKENLSMLIETSVEDSKYLNSIKNIILKEKEIIKIKNLYILINGPYYKLISDVKMDTISLKQAHDIIEKVEYNLKQYDDKIKYIFIHMEPIDKDN